MFSTLHKTNFKFSPTFILSSANAFDLDKPQILSFGNELNLRYSSRDNLQVQKITQCLAKLMGWVPPISRPNGSKMTRGKCIRFFGLKITLVKKKRRKYSGHFKRHISRHSLLFEYFLISYRKLNRSIVILTYQMDWYKSIIGI